MEEFFAEIERPIYRFMLRLCGDTELAADLSQEALLRGWQKRGDLREPQARQAWMFRIAVNTWRDRQRRSPQTAFIENPIECASRERLPEAQLMEREVGQQIWQAIGELPMRQQQVMHLRVIELLEISEIAEALQIERQTVRSNLAAARKKLRERFRNTFEGSFMKAQHG